MFGFFRGLKLVGESLVFGPAYAAVNNLIRNPEPLEPERLWEMITSNTGNWVTDHYPPRWVRRLLIGSKMRQSHAKGISKHYDVSNDFYELFLDSQFRFYSCADYHSDDETLEQAQTHKAEFLADLIDPQPGEKILDLGCGWGAMLKFLSERTGEKDNLFGYTLSKEQVAFNEQKNGFQVEFKNFIHCDYQPESYDKIYSIGSWEHVRLADLTTVTEKLYSALRPGGRLVKHFICPLDGSLTMDVLVAQLFFPGSWIPGYSTQMKTFEAAGFRTTKQSLHDYRPTLRAWFENLVFNRDKAIELVGLRTYNRYLVFFAASYNYFDRGKAVLMRIQLEK